MWQFLVIVLAILLPIFLATGLLIGRYLYRRQVQVRDLSPVTRQHIELFQGGQLNEAAVESAKARFRTLLERGEVEAVEASLRPGTNFAIQVRALAEIGTDDAGRILERQLQRRLTDDQIEQSWYWIDLASGLRSLNREQSLPHLLRCAEAAADNVPLGHFFAAETVCFMGFSSYLYQVGTPLGQAALRVLQRALEGLRWGVQPHVVVEGRLGEMIENLWDRRPEKVHALVVRVFVEALRHLRRAGHGERILAEEKSEQEAYKWQVSHLAALEPVLEDYLNDAAPELCKGFDLALPGDQQDLLHALIDLRAEAASSILPLVKEPAFPHVELALDLLTWSKDPGVGPFLRDWVVRRVPMDRRAMARPRATPPRQRSIPPDVPYRTILRVLRGHPSPETEAFLLLASHDWDPTFRYTAVSSLGWWEPLDRPDVLLSLQRARRDISPEVRQAARAALARLGERQSLQWFRQALNSQDNQNIHEAIQIVAGEGLMLLFPDLDKLAESEDMDIAYHAREALERLCEDMTRPLF